MSSTPQNRREFLGSALGAAGFAMSLPALTYQHAFCADTPPSESIRMASIGVGGQGKSNLKAFLKRVVAVCDVDSKRLAEAADTVKKANGDCGAEKEYRRLLDRKDIDAVIVSTPDHWHALPTIDACLAGKDVYCEKPLTLTIAEGQAMVKAARQTNRIVQTGSQQRSDDRFRQACELVRNGVLGKIHTVKVGIPKVNFSGPAVADSDAPAELDYDLWLGPAPKRPYNSKRVHYLFRFFWDYSGGQMTNFGAHHLDIAQWGLGMDESGPIAVEAKAKFHPQKWYEVPEHFEAIYTYAGGIKLICSQSLPGGTEFIGEKGSIFVTRGKITGTPEELLKAKLPADATKLYVSKNHHQNFLDCIRSRKLPICDVAIGHRSATVCHLGNIAIRLGRAIQWDPKTETIVGDSDAAAWVARPYRAPWKLPELKSV
ncbi:Gfo/Idh/MocA family protein [Tuwongella immobilis]|uniref:Gfo/Idh/MocA-like oxidoreductase N-terminal domain-containing protein n=1 Tax=Tuwongella immobilis TaxID=692036 RepID=A0A6C2YHP1_9BACT|nr:Gfo/Idh/MocA family oxidoreductase [Tuwongella immobilis]VIP01040.1 oxidoreductase domain-containing protein : Oxidoreductase domain protein OS=Pirellula staleyi (strain ATCC 27377 / DSM 6068 / ICPB 4128) GN=Psta_2822 PE=4 SV=1: GFO_IDH_MocA [Tuwongella immobilis]VTR97505.1 oxidoreductase domain-containing protein : Oxidoreductase domain protein OS=Pirellula staleyi (strain ATCC 27377 / DSM 6068 / ICPB 4128) GN=Psta_2822 PE=4 SV=1: GFO_IDH_MocA [Tuwongella immobilis]